MKKIFLCLLPILLAPTITACQDKEHSIIPIHATEDETWGRAISLQEFSRLVDAKQDFVVEFYTTYCSHCEELSPKIEKYISETRNLIFRLDLTNTSIEDFKYYQELYPSIIVDDYVPAVRFISNGTLTYEVNRNKFESYTAFRSIMNKHFLSSHLTMISTIPGLSSFKSNYSTYLTFGYDTQHDFSVEFAAKHIITEEMVQKDIPIGLVDLWNMLSSIPAFEEEYGIDYSYFVAYIENNKVKKVADYSASDFDFDSFIASL